MRILQRAAVIVALALAPLALVVGVAQATPDYGHVSGSGEPGRVVSRTRFDAHCGGPQLVVRNSANEPDAKRSSGRYGTFTVCVTPNAYANQPVGSWFNNESGTTGTVG